MRKGDQLCILRAEVKTDADGLNLLRLVAALPADQAEMVMLRVVAGLDVATVAGLVGKSPGAVRVAVHRALKSLSQDPGIRSTREVV